MPQPHFTALLTYLPESQGGLKTPVSSGFRANLRFPYSSSTVSGAQHFVDTNLAFPGDTLAAEITLFQTDDFREKLYEGLDFAFYQGDLLIGTGIITKMLDLD